MATSRILQRLLEVRRLEEELSQAALEDALNQLRLLEAALRTARERERGGRRHLAASAGSADAADRIAALEETRAASRYAAVLEPRIGEMETQVAARRQEFLAKRMERRQVETLIRKIEARERQGAARRAQQVLDDWHLAGRARAAFKARDRET
jgi:flagellar biosynthesis chaperone FliJ